jgi:hypothetical protein
MDVILVGHITSGTFDSATKLSCEGFSHVGTSRFGLQGLWPDISSTIKEEWMATMQSESKQFSIPKKAWESYHRQLQDKDILMLNVRLAI